MNSSANLPALQPTDILPPRAGASAATRRLRLAGVSPTAINDALALSEAAQDAAAQVRSRRTLAFLLCLIVAGLISTSGSSSLPRPLMVAEALTPTGAATTPEGQAAGTPTAEAAPDALLSVEAQPAAPQPAPADTSGGPVPAQPAAAAAVADLPSGTAGTPSPSPAPPLNAARSPAPDAAAPRTASGPKDATPAATSAAHPRPAPMPPKVARADRCAAGCAPPSPRLAEVRAPAVTPVAARPAPYVPPPPVDSPALEGPAVQGPTVVDVALFPVTASAALVGNAQASVGAAVDVGRGAVETLARVLR